MFLSSFTASSEEQHQAMPADSIVPNPIYAETRAITLRAPVECVWPWLAQMGSGRAGWYAYDRIDNGGNRGNQIFIERIYSLLAHIPRPLMLTAGSFGHGLMHSRQLNGIKVRAEALNRR